MPDNYEEQFTAFIDFLGFSEASGQIDESIRAKTLALLLALSSLRGDFDLQSTTHEGGGKQSRIKPAISTFSDNIVISFPLGRISKDMDSDEYTTAVYIMSHFSQLLVTIAAFALRIGFLVRGGATIGNLYHAQGVVFGEALIEAFQIESQIAVYPRVVLSPAITERQAWVKHFEVRRADDGLYHIDYFKMLAVGASAPGENYGANTKAWFAEAVGVIENNLRELESGRKLKELSKWAWFAREFRSGMERLNPELRKALGISPESIPLPK